MRNVIKDIQQSQGLIQDRLDTSTERLVRREKEGRREEECVCVCVCVCARARDGPSVSLGYSHCSYNQRLES